MVGPTGTSTDTLSVTVIIIVRSGLYHDVRQSAAAPESQ